MQKKLLSVFSILLIVAFMLSACGTTNAAPVEAPAEAASTASESETATESVVEVVVEEQPFGENLPTEPTIDTPLVVAYDQFSQKFSPFFADSGYDQDVDNMVQIQILTTDRTGGIVYNAIEGETITYNGTDYLYKGPADVKVEYDSASDTTTYTAKLRVGMKFSDGEPVTADDIIFNYYTLLDPSYVGSSTL